MGDERRLVTVLFPDPVNFSERVVAAATAASKPGRMNLRRSALVRKL